MNSSAFCKDDQRRDAVRARPGMNGLDYLEVSDDQLTLTVFFLGKAPPQLLRGEGEDAVTYQKRLKQAVRIEGGRRIRGIHVENVEVRQATDPETGEVDPSLDDTMLVRLDKYGDFSTYTLRLIGDEHIDPFYDHLDFSFKVNCPSDLDCAPADTCPPPTLVQPEINYLAKDYASFRQLILDRLALIMPAWQERHVPDVGMALVEVLAYVGDHLSYYQDAVASEAYLDTARQRISVRRHARLVDYPMHEGCNARAWVCVETDIDFTGDNALDPKQVFFITGYNDALSLTGASLAAGALQSIPANRYEVFEPMTTHAIQLYAAHNEICFYTWGQRECCLPRGATSATLREVCSPTPAERSLQLQAGDVLIFEERIGPRTGNPADADPSHRHAVRLTRVSQGEDALYDPPAPIVEIEWGAEDALPFPLCISAVSDAANDCQYIDNISVACGNVILVDHGRTQSPQDLGVVPGTSTPAECDCAGHPGDIAFVAGRYRPRLDRAALTFCQRLPQDDPAQHQIVAASRLLEQEARAATPQITLNSTPAAAVSDWRRLRPLYRLADLLDPVSLVSTLRDPANPIASQLRARFSQETLQLLDQPPEGDTIPAALQQALIDELTGLLQTWSVQPDLLGSQPDDRYFVVEVDNDGRGHLRFGNGELGRLPQAGASFFATYRVGNGQRGNVGADAIAHLVPRNIQLSGITRVHNPLPAQGGTEPEPIAEAKLFAPFAFRKELQRAITADDYAQLAQRDFKDQVQRAAAVLAWTGSWYEAEVTVDPFGSEEASQAMLDAIQCRLYRYRRIGHDVSVMPARYVSLDIEMTICVQPHYLRGHVEAALLDVLGNRVLPDGKRGFFHPDNLTFGEGIYLSRLVAVAQAVTGVESVQVTKLQRLDASDNGELDRGLLPLGPLEVARLDNDPNFPEHGRLTLDMRGGR
jgi:hypothetical protein